MEKTLFLQNYDVFEKRVFLRADLNVTIINGQIRDNYRLKAIIPTVEYLFGHDSRIILASHIGRPESPNLGLSTKQLIPWFTAQGYTIDFEPDLDQAEQKSHQMEPGTILLLENLRFFSGENSTNKKLQTNFARQLSALTDIYVNDAFGLLHRNDTSITTLPHMVKPQNRCFGLTIERELKNLSRLKKKPAKPFVLVLGGNKLKTKIPLITGLLEAPKKARPDHILVGGALAMPLIKPTPDTQHILKLATEHNVQIVLPSDLLAITGPLGSQPIVTKVSNLKPDQKCVDIGPETTKQFSQIISKAQTVFTNGTMGMYEHPEYQEGTRAILEAIASNRAHSIIGGGDAIAAAHHFDIIDTIDFISTGGGATLAYLSSQDPWSNLPGLAAFN